MSPTAVCPRCREEKLTSAFYVDKRRGRPTSYCKPCHRQYYRDRVASDPTYLFRKQQKLKKRKQAHVASVKSAIGCIECGETHPAVLDFHHRDPSTKTATVAELTLNNGSMARVLAEAAKCDVLCANCHRKHHWAERYPSALLEAVESPVTTYINKKAG